MMRFAPSISARKTCFALWVSLTLSGAAGTASAMPLNEVVDEVLKSHPDIRSASHLLDAARARVKQAKSNYYPTLGFSYEYSKTDGDQSGASVDTTTNRSDAILSWTVFNGFATKHSVQSTHQEKLAAEAELAATHEAIALDITDSYLSLLQLSYTAIRNDKYISELKSLVNNIDLRVAAGRLSAAQSAQAKTRLIQAENENSMLKAQLEGAKVRYQTLTGFEPKDLRYPKLSTSIANEPLDQLMRISDTDNPNILAGNMKAQARNADIGTAQAEFFPNISLEMRKRIHSDLDDDTSFDQDTGATLQLTYEVPLGGGAFGRKTEAEQRKLSADEDVKGTKLQIHTSLGRLQKQLIQTLQISPRLRENIDSTEQVYRAYTAQFNAGKRSLLDLLSALGDKHRAHTSVIDNWYQSTLATAQIHSLTGHLRQHIASATSQEK